MSSAALLLFLAGLASALPTPSNFEFTDYEGSRLEEIIDGGAQKLQKGEEGSYELYNLARNVLQAFETLSDKLVPKEIKEEDVRKAGFLHLNEKELLELKKLATKLYTSYTDRNTELTILGKKRMFEGQKPNIGLLKFAKKVLGFMSTNMPFYQPPAFNDFGIVQSGLLQLTKFELNEMWVNAIKIAAAYPEITSQE